MKTISFIKKLPFRPYLLCSKPVKPGHYSVLPSHINFCAFSWPNMVKWCNSGMIIIGNSMTCSGIWQWYREWYFKIVWNTTSREGASGIWKILKYYKPVLLPNTKCRSCYYLFIIEAEKFSVTHKRPFFLRLKKTDTGVYVRNNLFTSMEEMIHSFLWNQCKPFKANNMKQFNESNL